MPYLVKLSGGLIYGKGVRQNNMLFGNIKIWYTFKMNFHTFWDFFKHTFASSIDF